MPEETDAALPPVLPDTLPQDERYVTLLATAIRKCRGYQPKFGQGRGDGLTAAQFAALYSADPFYHWLGIDSPFMYAAHKAAGGMTSIYRQVGIGTQWVFFQILQDCLGLTQEQATWKYTIDGAGGASRQLALDGRITLADVADTDARNRVADWMREAAAILGLPETTLANLQGAVFEARQGYKSKDSKRQNADVANAAKAYAHLYLPTILLFSTQIDGGVALRYRAAMWLILTGTTEGTATDSTYIFCRDVVGYDLAAFFQRNAPRLRSEIEGALTALLTA